jgi:hypothetical protein
MTNSHYENTSSDSFKIFSYSLAIIALLCASFISVLVLTNQSSVAHGESLNNPSELNAKYFTDDTSEKNRLADAGSRVASDDNTKQDNTSDLLAQADSQTQNNQCDYLTENLRIDMTNDSQQVYRLQAFLQSYAYNYVDLTGEFDEDTLRAVQAFQTRHADDILEPWGYEPDEATGYVYITTRQKINEIYCGQELELTASQQDEIASYREKLNRWRAQGAEFDTPQYLAQYRGQTNQTASSQTTSDSQTNTTDNDEVAIDTNDDNQDSASVDDEASEDNEAVSGTSAAATGSEETDDNPGFFAQLFGQNDSSQNDNTDTQATSATNTDDSQDMNATNTDDVAAATSGVDQAATSVYSGVNSFVGFIFSPTFLLILLGVLILLLIATLLEDEEGDEYEEITADDFAKDFEGVDQDSDDTDETDSGGADSGSSDDGDGSESTESKSDSKTKSADFDDTPAGSNGDSSKDSSSSSSSSSS